MGKSLFIAEKPSVALRSSLPTPYHIIQNKALRKVTDLSNRLTVWLHGA